MKKTNRGIAFVLALVLMLLSVSEVTIAEAKTASNTYTLNSDYRITLDGTTYRTDAYMNQKKEVFITSTAAKKLLGKKPTGTVKIKGKAYVSLSKYANQCKVFSYEYDSALNASYLWTKDLDSFSDANRIKYYALGTASNKKITYKKFFQLLDATVKIANEKKLKTWKSKLSAARKSTRTMTKAEGMMAILNMAIVLGSDYSEFNKDWGIINEEIGEKCWDELNAIYEKHDPFQYMKNVYPYNMGGFKKDDYVYDDWDAFGVALRYSYGRISLCNQKTLFDYDKENKTMHLGDEMTYSDALNALTRLLDSTHKENMISLSDAKAVNYDSSIITPELMKNVQDMPTYDNGDLSDWRGFVFYEDYGNKEIHSQKFDVYAKCASEWGLDNIRYPLTYESLFDRNVTKVKEEQLKKLDYVIACAMKYKIHLNILTFTLPGRWADTDSETFTSIGEFDLFTNAKRQQEAKKVWDLLAQRYQDIPSSVLSFCPLWEVQNWNLSTGLNVEPYTQEQIAEVYSSLISVIQNYRKDRLVVFEPSANNSMESILNETKIIKDKIENQHNNVQIIFNFCEQCYVYAEMTAIDGEHIDNNNHSMFKPAYPTTIYAAKRGFLKNQPFILNGDLVKGSELTIYLSKTEGNGTFLIKGDGKELYSEQLVSEEYKTEGPLSRYYSYAKSSKYISILLTDDVDEISLSYDGDYWEWSGIDVKLPQSYAVKKWWNTSAYDLFLEGKEQTLDNLKPKLKSTSLISISPNSNEEGDIIAVHSDIIFSSNSVLEEANAATINAWGEVISDYAPNSLVRCESAGFCIGSDLDSALRYYEDFMKMCQEYHLGFFLNDFECVLSEMPDFSEFKYGGAKPARLSNGYYVMPEIVKLMQKYAKTPKKIK